jgi:glycosyltransferase involved in cell wall biosynthesis
VTSDPTHPALAGRRVVHLTTTDMTLALLLGPQLRAFAEAGMDVIGASAAADGYAGELTQWGIRHEPVQHATRSKSIGQDVQALTELVRLFRRLRPDIVHTHNPKPGVYGRVAARLAGVPIVVNTVHGLYATPDDPILRRTLVYGLERTVSVCSQTELVQNEEDLATLARLRVPARKLVLLGNGIDMDRFGPRPADAVAAARRSMGVAEGKILVGMVGRLVWEKGFAELFEAARRLAASCPEVAIVIVGPGDPAKSNALSEADLRSASEIGNISFLGERKDVEDLYPGMDLFVLPSYREGFPRAAMEAAACGVPVVATDIRGCRQVVDHGTTGLLVPARDGAALAGALEALARDPARRRAMSEASVVRARAEFDDRKVIGITLEVYERLLSRSPGRPPRSSSAR